MKHFFYTQLRSLAQLLAQRMITRHQPKIIAVAGSIGKTSSIEAIHSVLKNDFTVWKTFDFTYEDSLSVPLVILGFRRNPRGIFDLFRMLFQSIFFYHRIQKYPDVLLLEVRSQKPGDVEAVIDIVKSLDVLVYTAIHDDAIEVQSFDDFKSYRASQRSLMKVVKNDGFVVYDYDSEHARSIGEKYKRKKRSIGFDGDADLYAEAPHLLSEDVFDGIGFKMHYEEQKSIPVQLPDIIAFHHVYAALNAIAIARHFEMNLVEISEKIRLFEPARGRMKVSMLNDQMVIDDSYASSVTAKKSGIQSLQFLAGEKRKIAIMNSSNNSEDLIQRIADTLDVLITVGADSKSLSVEVKKRNPNLTAYHFDLKTDFDLLVTKKIFKKEDVIYSTIPTE